MIFFHHCHTFNPLKTLASFVLLLGLFGCASSSKTDLAGNADFRQKADRICAQINACRATSEGVTAIKGPTHNSLMKGSATIVYSNASINNAGVMKVSSLDVGTTDITLDSLGTASQTRTTTTEKISVPLAQVNTVYLGDWGTSQELGVSNSGTSKLAGLTTQARFDVSVFTDNEAVAKRSVSVSSDSFGSKPTKFVSSDRWASGTVATFQTRAQAVQFSRELHDLISILRKGKPLSLKLDGSS